jgi:8-oxo-dGTP pyrophosphatase MutT (NUDIX family)
MEHLNPIAARMYSKKRADENTKVRVGVGVVITNAEGWILLEKRSDCALWGFPGGRIEAGESIREAAVREVFEETGLTVRITRLLGAYSEPSERIVTFLDNGEVVQLVDLMVEATILSGELTCSSESLELRFFDPAHLPPDMVPPALSPLNDYLAGFIGVLR